MTESKSKQRRSFKIIVIGDSGVGKTCLTFRFCAGKFPEGITDTTIGVDFRERVLSMNSEGESIRMQLWDTAGQERFRKSMISHYYRNVNAVVLVYDVTSSSSFSGLVHWISECETHGLNSSTVPIILIGNKCDEKNKVVSTLEAQKCADEYGLPYFETSAKDDSLADHVDAIFLTLAHKLINNQRMAIPVESSSSASSPSKIKLLYKNKNYIYEEEEGGSGSCCGVL